MKNVVLLFCAFNPLYSGIVHAFHTFFEGNFWHPAKFFFYQRHIAITAVNTNRLIE